METKKLPCRDEWVAMLTKKTQFDFDDLLKVMAILRADGGCPWDIEQTHKSIRRDFIEETYEVIEAIDKEDSALLREELGDVLLQVVFHARIEEEEERFGMSEVVSDLCRKLIHRHPHVFGEVSVKDTDQVLANWEKLKGEEKTDRVTLTDKLRAIPPMLPALMRAQKIGKKAACFDFADAEEALAKLREETDETQQALREGNETHLEEEIGDLLFSAVSVSRKCGVQAEEALQRATEKFLNRFEAVEDAVLTSGRKMEEVSMAELDEIWEKIKQNPYRA